MRNNKGGFAVGRLSLVESATETAHPRIVEKVARAVAAAYPDARVQSGGRGVTVFGEGKSGFPVSVEDVGDGRLLYVGSGMIEFDDDDNLIEYVLQACSPDCRLHVARVGKTVREWKLVVGDARPERVLLSGGSVSVFSVFYRVKRSVYVNDGRAQRRAEPGV